MAKRHKEGTEVYHDRVANIYDGIYSNKPYWDFYWTITWRNLKKYLPTTMPTRVLDIGCGTGRWGLKMLKSGYHADFLDISENMLKQVSHKLDNENLSYRPSLIHASIDDLSALDENVYDFITGQGDPLSCARNPKKALKELTKILKPGGTMVMSVDNRHCGYTHFLEKGDLSGLEKFIKTGKTEWLTDKKEEQFPLTMFTPKGLQNMFENAGYEVLSIIGKTVLPVRSLNARNNNILTDTKEMRRLIKIEESLNSKESLLGSAAHLEIAARLK
jgi:ubiquinone/menaquinone biosynthesis C-methylase UbiE